MVDIETTGLNLSGGDVPVSIGAVRVVNGRVLPMENFERLVNPGRTIPPDSIRFHGITDAMVEGKPPLPLVLPQFERFVGDSVLVAHNAAFDMLALTRGAAGCGLSFDHPIVDTLLISAWLDPEEADHSLEGLAARLGLQVAVRHHALNDAMLAAAILVRQFDQLESRGVERFAHDGRRHARQAGGPVPAGTGAVPAAAGKPAPGGERAWDSRCLFLPVWRLGSADRRARLGGGAAGTMTSVPCPEYSRVVRRIVPCAVPRVDKHCAVHQPIVQRAESRG